MAIILFFGCVSNQPVQEFNEIPELEILINYENDEQVISEYNQPDGIAIMSVI